MKDRIIEKITNTIMEHAGLSKFDREAAEREATVIYNAVNDEIRADERRKEAISQAERKLWPER